MLDIVVAREYFLHFVPFALQPASSDGPTSEGAAGGAGQEVATVVDDDAADDGEVERLPAPELTAFFAALEAPPPFLLTDNVVFADPRLFKLPHRCVVLVLSFIFAISCQNHSTLLCGCTMSVVFFISPLLVLDYVQLCQLGLVQSTPAVQKDQTTKVPDHGKLVCVRSLQLCLQKGSLALKSRGWLLCSPSWRWTGTSSSAGVWACVGTIARTVCCRSSASAGRWLRKVCIFPVGIIVVRLLRCLVKKNTGTVFVFFFRIMHGNTRIICAVFRMCCFSGGPAAKKRNCLVGPNCSNRRLQQLQPIETEIFKVPL